MRIILAGIAGGIVLFIWGALSHTVLPFGDIGMKTLPNEAPVMAALKANITEPGLYFYPGIEGGHSANEAEQAAFEAKFKSGPHGILIYHPIGTEVMPPSMMITELISNILAAILVALVISWLICSFWGRVAAAALFGLVSWLSVDASYWNWYGFPTDYFAAQAIDQVVGWFLAGLAIAVLVKGRGPNNG
jgi:hypothetical protein